MVGILRRQARGDKREIFEKMDCHRAAKKPYLMAQPLLVPKLLKPSIP